MEFDLLKNLSVITSIPESSLTKLTDKINWCICDNLYQTIQSHDITTDINLGFGILTVNNNSDSISYRFKPSAELEEAIKSVILDNVNPLKVTLEKNLINRITNTYKDIIL